MPSLLVVSFPHLNPFLVFLLLLNAYFLFLYVLVKKGWLARFNMSLFGPALMIKTQRGRGLLDWFAKARGLFDRAAAFGIYLTATVMLLMSLLLVAQLYLILQLTPAQAPSPKYVLGIPGINPIIPVGYGILALIFAVVVHEFGHGILARVHQLRVKTMGILFLIIPIGAFVEPDDEELKRAPRRQRIKVFSAGPTMNLFFALVFALLFSPVLMASAQPVPGVPLLGVERDGPSCAAGLQPGWIITATMDSPQGANRTEVRNRDDLVDRVNASPPNSTLYLTIRETRVGSAPAPDCVNKTANAQEIYAVRTRRCIEQYTEAECFNTANALGHPDPRNRTVIGVSFYPTDQVRSILVNPFQSPRHFVYYISLPFLALQNQFPLSGTFNDFYTVPFHAGTFWFLANTIYWLFWINLMLGLTNALPIIPLDGGYMFRDFLGGWLERRNPNIDPDRRDGIVRRVSLIVALTLLSLVIFQFVGPHLVDLFRRALT